MTVAAVLMVYALTLGFVLPRLLSTPTLADRAPRLVLLLWQGAAVSVVASMLMAGIVLAVPTVVFSGGLADLLHECVMALRAQYATPGGAVIGVAGVSLAALVTVRGLAVLLFLASATRRARASHQDALTLLGTRHPKLGITVVAHEDALAYCLPGRKGQIVVTSGALDSLDDDELAAVLAHERAHLAAHHHVAVGFATGLAKAFPHIPLFRIGAEQVAALVELLADDRAGRTAGRYPVATALVALSACRAPAMALAAGGPNAVVRVQRMLAPVRPLGAATTAAVIAIGLTVFAAPLAIATGPALAARNMNLCPLDSAASHAPLPLQR